MADNETKPNNRKVDPAKVKVRVIGKQAINERGQHYQPGKTVAGKVTPGDTFETTPARAEALGEHVEVVTD